MKLVMSIAIIVLVSGCSQQPVYSNKITLDPNQTLATRSADDLACRDNTHLVCRDVIGARVESPMKDCSCLR